MTNGMNDSLLMLRLARACLNLAMLTSFFGVWHNLCSEFLLDGQKMKEISTTFRNLMKIARNFLLTSTKCPIVTRVLRLT